MQINYYQGTNFTSAPSWLTTVLFQVSAFYDTLFTNNITLNVTVNWVPLAWTQTTTNEGGTLASNSLSGGPAGVTSSFSTVSGALAAHATNTTQSEAYSNMPGGVGSVYVAPAEAMVLGLESNQTVSINLNVNSSANWLGADGFAPLDAFAAIAHEITETAMGRVSNPTAVPDIMDMFRFSGSAAHDLTSGTSSSNTSAYFSVDNGATPQGYWNNQPNNGDYGDWLQGSGPIADDAYGGQGGGVAPISEVDIELMNVLGWSTDVVTSGNWLKVPDGVTSNGLDIMSGGLITVSAGAVASNTTYTDAQQFNDGVLAPASSSFDTEALGFIAGTDISATVDGGGAEWVDFGGAASGTIVNGNGYIINFGDTNSALLNGGSETVESGGASDFTSVQAGATLSILLSGGGIGDHVADGGTEVVLGQAVFETISAGGTQIVSAGGLDAGGSIGGTQDVYGVASGDTVSGIPANQYIEAGGSAVSAALSAVGYQYVLSGGYASATTVSATTRQIVESAGVARATVVLSGGTVILDAGGTGDALTVSAGGLVEGAGVLIDHSTVAGTVEGVTVGDDDHFDQLELLAGGVASGVTVTIVDDFLQVDSGASATGTILMSHGYDVVYGSAASTTVGSAATENVYSGGEATATTVLGGGTENLAADAMGDGLTVAAGGMLNGPGVLIDHSTVAGTVSGVTVGDLSHYDELELLAGGVAETVIVTIEGDFLRVDSGASATGTILTLDAYDVVLGSTTSTTVSGGSDELISSGGIAVATKIFSGGVATISSGGRSVDATILSGGIEHVLAFGETGGTVVSEGGQELVSSSGIVGRSTLRSGGEQYVSLGGSANETTVSSGGIEYVLASGTTTATVVSAGGYERVSSGGSASRTTVANAGRLYVYSDGVASVITVSSGGALTVLSGGAASGAVLSGGGEEVVSSGGDGFATTISSGGNAAIYAAGTAVGTTLLSGGLEYILSGAGAEETVVSSGGDEVVSSGGGALGLTVRAGGTVIDDGKMRYSGVGSLDGSLEGSGSIAQTAAGDLVLSGAGAAFSGRAVIEAGTIELATAGALGTGTVQFVEPSTGSAVLQIDAADAPVAGGTFANTLYEFNGANEDIDLRSIAFVSGAKAKIVGSTLVLTDGGKTYTFNVGGTTAGAYPVLSDGHGGTLIDPKAATLTQAIAAFAPPSAATAGPISRTTSSAETPFLHATASVLAGRL
jgi:autotransporter passenger strand-loop-strand repeat protein